MKARVWIGAAIVVLLLLAGYYFASPFLAMQSFSAAIKGRDQARLERLVDFTAVREGLKSDLDSQVSARLQTDRKLRDSSLGALGALFAPMLVDKAIDSVVTPKGIVKLAGQDVLVGEPAEKAEPASAEPKTAKVTYRYTSLNRFEIVQPRPQGVITWELARRGPFAWKLVRVGLPPDLINQIR